MTQWESAGRSGPGLGTGSRRGSWRYRSVAAYCRGAGALVAARSGPTQGSDRAGDHGGGDVGDPGRRSAMHICRPSGAYPG
jgi:hypothetical protein